MFGSSASRSTGHLVHPGAVLCMVDLLPCVSADSLVNDVQEWEIDEEEEDEEVCVCVCVCECVPILPL